MVRRGKGMEFREGGRRNGTTGQRQGSWSTAPTLTGCRQFPMALQAQGRQSTGPGLSVSSCGSKISAQG